MIGPTVFLHLNLAHSKSSYVVLACNSATYLQRWQPLCLSPCVCVFHNFTPVSYKALCLFVSLSLCVWKSSIMNPHSLFASAAINIGLALIILTLFSIFKKQPSNAPIYYARRISHRHHIHFHQSLSLRRFLPSVSWIPRAFRVTEDEILDSTGLDALVIIRLFKFGSVFLFCFN